MNEFLAADTFEDLDGSFDESTERLPVDSRNDNLIEEAYENRDDLKEPKKDVNHEQTQSQIDSDRKPVLRSNKLEHRKLGISEISRSYQHMDKYSGRMD